MSVGIYIITNKINNKQYIGQSLNCKARSQMHLRSKGGAPILYNALKKYGKENFEVEIIAYPGISQLALDAVEKWKIKQYNTIAPYGYNIRDGGSGGGLDTEKTKQKKSIAKKGKNNPMFGYQFSNETKKKIAASLTGRKASEETKKKQSLSMTGKKHSAETLEKISNSSKGINKGKKHSKEHKKKISEGLKKYYQNKKMSE